MKLTSIQVLATSALFALASAGPLLAEEPLEYTNEIAPEVTALAAVTGITRCLW